MGQLTLHQQLRQLYVSAEQLIGPFWHLMPPEETWWKEDGELSLKKLSLRLEAPIELSSSLTKQNFGALSCSRPWIHLLRVASLLHLV